MDTRLRSAAALLALQALGCSDTDWARTTETIAPAATSAVQLALTLPDGTELRSIDYTVSGAGLTRNRVGFLNVSESSAPVRFRVGDLPVATGYRIVLAALTTNGKPCVGEANFTIADNLVTALSLQLVCSAGSSVQTDDQGDVSATVVVTSSAGVTCPVVTGISALPSEVNVGSTLELAGFASSSDGVQYTWSGTGGTFTNTSSAATGFVCGSGGDHRLSLAVAKPGCPTSNFGVDVSCSPPRFPTCAACLDSRCSSYVGVDLVGPCFEGRPSDLAVVDAQFAVACTDAFLCSATSSAPCGYGPAGPTECYCGRDVSFDECSASVDNANGNCVAEWTRAAGCPANNTDPACVLDSFGDLSRPSGFANFMLECLRDECAVECRAPIALPPI